MSIVLKPIIPVFGPILRKGTSGLWTLPAGGKMYYVVDRNGAEVTQRDDIQITLREGIVI